MPEGPETHRMADRLRAALVGDALARVRFINPAYRKFERLLKGRVVLSVTAHGKALLTEIEGGWTLYTHSQLFGFWRIDDGTPKPINATVPRLVLQTANARARLFAAPTVEVLATDAVHTHRFLSKLGPDVLDRKTTASRMRKQLADARFAAKPLSQLLLDQSFAAGMGNYLRSEVLHRACIAPTRTPASLDAGETKALATALLGVPRASYWVQSRDDAEYASDAARFVVFDREGAPCPRDGAPIVQVRMGERRLYWCPVCQR